MGILKNFFTFTPSAKPEDFTLSDSRETEFDIRDENLIPSEIIEKKMIKGDKEKKEYEPR